MVRGLDVFRNHFEPYRDMYVLIGGTACSVAMERVGLRFRATKDLDIVLIVESLDGQFAKSFWDFIRAGRYQNEQKSTGKKLFYRFYQPEDDTYPVMLELFSRIPDSLHLSTDSHLTPIPLGDEISSLSAVLMNDDYYDFISAGKEDVDGLPVVKPEYLIPLKARAWIDLTDREAKGKKVDRKDIRKHKNDVFRLYQIIAPDSAVEIGPAIADDMRRFLSKMEADQSLDLRNLGLKSITPSAVLADLRRIYAIERQDLK